MTTPQRFIVSFMEACSSISLYPENHACLLLDVLGAGQDGNACMLVRIIVETSLAPSSFLNADPVAVEDEFERQRSQHEAAFFLGDSSTAPMVTCWYKHS